MMVEMNIFAFLKLNFYYSELDTSTIKAHENMLRIFINQLKLKVP